MRVLFHAIRAGGWLLGLMGTAANLAAQSPAPADVLTNAAQVRNLTPEQAAKALPVSLTGVVVHNADPNRYAQHNANTDGDANSQPYRHAKCYTETNSNTSTHPNTKTASYSAALRRQLTGKSSRQVRHIHENHESENHFVNVEPCGRFRRVAGHPDWVCWKPRSSQHLE